MIGITAFGTYVPRYRISSEQFGVVWGKRASGQRAVANYDQDTVTMAAEAVLNCLEGRQPSMIDGLYFASTTAPYAEKQNAALVAAVADLSRESISADFAGSLRAGTTAIRSAVDAVRAGTARQVLVAVADCRLGMPGSDDEHILGDAAAAMLIGSENVLAELKGSYSVTEQFLDVWRKQDDCFINSGDQRFIQLYGYERYLPEAIEGLIKKCGVKKEDVAEVVFYAPNPRQFKELTKKLSLAQKTYNSLNLLESVGNTGCASPLLALAGALERARPGDKIIVAGYGDGADALLFEATEEIRSVKPQLAAQIANGRMLPSYGRYLQFRNLVNQEKIPRYTSEMLLWREQKADLALYGQKCGRCGAVQYPPRLVCWNCGMKGDFGNYRISRKGTVVTFTKDSLIPTPDPPVIMVVADLEGGGRIYAQLTDCDPGIVKIGMKVELTFRKYHEGGGFNNYFWKFRPVSAGEEV
ncbi:MAG: 3-hydroxy-3-methylglutaryl CoA synthase [Peptococcaceae bacterium]|nr:MAG: 3-hydroxy-3-methylglutaryl CoA synthase [Peptococcaceae bacterium]